MYSVSFTDSTSSVCSCTQNLFTIRDGLADEVVPFEARVPIRDRGDRGKPAHLPLETATAFYHRSH